MLRLVLHFVEDLWLGHYYIGCWVLTCGFVMRVVGLGFTFGWFGCSQSRVFDLRFWG